MTPEELRSKIAESQHVNWFSNREVDLNYKIIGFKTKIVGASAIYQFVYEQVDEFSKLEVPLPAPINRAIESFSMVKQNIINIVNDNDASDYDWVHKVRNELVADTPKFLHDSQETTFLISIHKYNKRSFAAAYHFLTSNDLSNITQKDYFIGFSLAYDFRFSDLKIAPQLEKNNNAFELYLSKCETDLIKFLNQAHIKTTEATKTIEELVSTKRHEYLNWFTDTNNSFEQLTSESKSKISILEELYRQKLKLEAPATYWRQRADKLRKEGQRWMTGLILCIVVAVLILTGILYKITNGDLEDVFKNTGTAIKWSIVLITTISFLAFAIRTFSKLTFSSFHLVRDAEEREQLVYVFLALQKEEKVDKTERHLIMQSLFSRADSGLLKDDASPTMPGNIIDKVMAKS